MGVTPSQALTCDDSKPTLFDLDVFDLDRDAFSARFSHYAGCAKEQSMRDVHVLSPTHTLSPTPVSPTAVHLTVRALSRVGKVKPAWQAVGYPALFFDFFSVLTDLSTGASDCPWSECSGDMFVSALLSASTCSSRCNAAHVFLHQARFWSARSPGSACLDEMLGMFRNPSHFQPRPRGSGALWLYCDSVVS